MKSVILNMLELTNDTYQKWVISNFFLWCNLNSIDDQDCQKLLANAALFNWWYREYSNLEEKFVWRFAEFRGSVDKSVMRDQYTEIVSQISNYYSRPLIKQARRHKPVTPQFN